MSTTQLNSMDDEKDVRLPMIIPLFKPKTIKQKWSKVRQEKVESIRRMFQKEPNLVFLLQDPKFDGDHLAMIKKSHLEDLINMNSDLSSGEASLRQSITSIRNAVDILIEAVSQNEEIRENNLIKKAIRLTQTQVQSVSQLSINYIDPPKDKGSPPLSEAEKVLLKEMGEDE